MMIRAAIQRAASAAAIAIASFFETGVDRLISEFIEIDGRLEKFISQQDAKLDRYVAQLDASYARQVAVADSEAAHREAIRSHGDTVAESMVRAQKIRDRVLALIGD